MRKQILSLLLVLSFVLAAGVVMAQVAPVFGEVRINVPFQFYAGDTQFAAGSYVIKRLTESDPTILTISPANGSSTSLLMVHLADNKTEAKTSDITFNKYGNRYFLESIAVQGYSNGSMVDKSHFEQLVAKGEVQGEGRHVTGSRKVGK